MQDGEHALMGVPYSWLVLAGIVLAVAGLAWWALQDARRGARTEVLRDVAEAKGAGAARGERSGGQNQG